MSIEIEKKEVRAGGMPAYLSGLAEMGIFTDLTPEQADLIVSHLKKGDKNGK